MKKIFFIIITCVTLFYSENLFAKGNVETKNQSLLWKISGNGLEKPSYLYGTIHMIPKDKFFVPKGTEDLISKAEALVLEIDLDIPMKKQIEMAQKMMLPQGKTYKDYLDSSTYAEVLSYLSDSLKMGEGKTERYMHIKPVYISGPILMEVYSDIEMYEKYFSKIAKKNKLELLSLETLDYQMGVLDSISLEEQFEDFNISEMFTEYEDLLEVYINQDIDGIHNIMNKNEKEEMLDLLFTLRNKNWAEKLTNEILPNQTVFIAVGSGHLPGENGVINLLRQKGYTVEPVN